MLAYILAVSIPPLGFVLGIVILLRSSLASSKHAALIILISVLAAVVWVVVLTSGSLNATDTGY